MTHYNYIIIGAGASGLLLADALGSDPYFNDKSILLLDKNDKTTNDRTWCFWEKGNGAFDSILFKKWSKIHFASEQLNIQSDIAPYAYKMIKGITFYQHYLNRLENYANITFCEDDIERLNEIEQGVWIQGKKNQYFGLQAFDSRFDYQRIKATSKYPLLQQHFLGWFVKSDQPVFDPKTPSFMDFSIPQNGNTRFMYVLPFSDREALVEYTLFSENILERTAYETAIKDYLTNLGVTHYKITEVEQGNIPMTCYDFTQENTNRILKIGMAGGWTKASTGYTFYNSFKRVLQLAEHLKKERPLKKFGKKNRFWYYDLLLLDILHKRNHLGRQLFESLFKKQKPQAILKFLDEETHILEEIKIISSPPPLPFIKALWHRIFN